MLNFHNEQSLASLFMRANREKWKSLLPPPTPPSFNTKAYTCLHTHKHTRWQLFEVAARGNEDEEKRNWVTDQSFRQAADETSLKRCCVFVTALVSGSDLQFKMRRMVRGMIKGKRRWYSAWVNCRFASWKCTVIKGFVHLDVRGEREYKNSSCYFYSVLKRKARISSL